MKESGLAEKGLVIGYDTRFASEDFASASAEVITGNGIKVYLTPEAIPTPVVSYGILNLKAGGGIVITASHNTGKWNGFKLKTQDGASAPTEVNKVIEKKVEAILASGKIEHIPLDEAIDKKLVEYLDLSPAYSQQIARLINLNELRNSNLKVVVDSMYGAGSGYFKRLLSGGNIEVAEIHNERNPIFPGIQPEPITANLSSLADIIKDQKADVGLATDGDADRLGIIDENGNFLTTLQVLSLLCLYLLEIRGERGLMVKTITTSSMLYKLGELFDVPVQEVPVGFKYVAPIMLAENALIGGEESGGYGFRGHMPERDGILAGLYFLDLMIKTGKKPSQLIDYLYSKVGPHHFNRTDYEFPEEERQTIIDRVKNNPPEYIDGTRVESFDTTDGFRFILADTSWLLIRFSGTEPLLRTYAESDSLSRVDRLLKFGKELAGV